MCSGLVMVHGVLQWSGSLDMEVGYFLVVGDHQMSLALETLGHQFHPSKAVGPSRYQQRITTSK